MASSENSNSENDKVLKATFMGVSTILFDDGSDSILIDGFFTRPSYFSVFVGRISPDEKEVRSCLEKASIATTKSRLRAVFVAHTHFDHALDSSTVCKLTGATLIGSESARNIAKGHNIPLHRAEVASDGDVFTYGSFKVTTITGVHSPGDISPGPITTPLSTPAKMKEFKTGECYSYLIKHCGRTIFVHPSANFVPQKIETLGIKASTLFLGVGMVGKQNDKFRENYWSEVVQPLEPKIIIPIHWDNFWKRLNVPLSPLPWPVDSWSVTKSWVESCCAKNAISLQWLQAWATINIPQ